MTAGPPPAGPRDPVVFLGSDDVAAHCLRELARRAHVALVVTPPERRRGRRGAPEPTPPGLVAAELGIPVLATPDVNSADALGRLRATHPRLLVVVAFGQLLRRAVRAAAPLGAINLHFSLLPRWRGAAPVQRALLAGDTETGVAVQRVARRLDAGPLLALLVEPIRDGDDTETLLARLGELGAPLLAGVAERLLAGDAPTETEQDETCVTIAPRIEKHEGDLDFAAESAQQLARRVRAFGKWPGCRFELPAHGEQGAVETLRVGRAEPIDVPPAPPGTVLAADAGGVVIAARAGALRMLELQRPGGRPLPAAAFLNGRPIAVGTRVPKPTRSSPREE